MARFQPLPMLVVVFAAGVLTSVWAALATNDVHLPEEQNTRRHHSYQKDGQPHVKASYPESVTSSPTFQFEHQQSEKDARQFVASMTDADMVVPSWCKVCNATMLHYCRTSRFINDHCCCEYAHTREQLPQIPHTCHRQLQGDCEVNAGSCGKYRVIKECCCDRETKQEYKQKYSSGSNIGPTRIMLLLGLACALIRSVLLHQLS
ncbi:uncharacterized protein LOC128709009 [Anopheles marshallii]|uniref:uncharacterized protein LOC128709009 n=1 Tax=Anopheles marshallii TaxID=1521116 RepID=UPI00237B19D4|nr:uncharacterized protein LOC128709009 [Anopheles marshallii]